ncbi:unnamed protein product [Meloidogyne enterolobii]|uniref:Uncharacterized protein n=1 Tax=Meloidogyne enterolobii TaxID=390850 RepID=A0ACB0ZHD6_MELEN
MFSSLYINLIYLLLFLQFLFYKIINCCIYPRRRNNDDVLTLGPGRGNWYFVFLICFLIKIFLRFKFRLLRRKILKEKMEEKKCHNIYKYYLIKFNFIR